MKIDTSFSWLVHEDLKSVEDLMRKQADSYHPDIGVALELLLESGGKRIRPTLSLLAGKMYGADISRLITLSAAIELLHTATLVHDDLIDGALLRRGSPTLNSQWSAGATVLTGDFLFSRAAYLAAETDSLTVMKLFAQTLTVIVNGEITQLFAGRCTPDKENYFQRIYAKTASLMETAAAGAVMVSSAEDEIVDQIGKFGYSLGMALQIIDEILDFTGNQGKLGKPVGSDLRQGLVTLPTIYFIEDHPDEPAVQSLLKGRCLDETEVAEFVEKIRTSDAIGKAHDEARLFVKKALDILRQHPAGEFRDALENLALYIVEREL